MKEVRRRLSQLMVFLLVFSLMPVTPWKMTARAETAQEASGSDALPDGTVVGSGKSSAAYSMKSALNAGTGHTVLGSVSNAELENVSYDESGNYSATLTADQGYTLPETLEVTAGTVNFVLVTEHDTDAPCYTYNSGTGAITIYFSYITDPVKVTGAAVSKETYTVIFNANAPEGSMAAGTMSAQSIHAGVPTVLTANAFTVSGYEFTGWNTSADGSGTLYADGAKVTDLAEANGSVTLYAQWNGTYTVIFNANAPEEKTAAGSMSTQSIYARVATALTANAFTVSGYEFTGWNTSTDGSGALYADGEKVTDLASPGGSVTLYAQWISGNNLWYIANGTLHIGAASVPSGAQASGTIDVTVPWRNKGKIDKAVVDDNCILPKTTETWFSKLEKMTECNLDGLDTSNVTSMSRMFYFCKGLYTLDVSKFDTSQVTKMFGMFAECSYLHTLDVSKFDTSQVTTMNGMFYNCNHLQSLNLSGFDTSNVTDMRNMFYKCYNLNSVTFGPNFAYKAEAYLPTPTGAGFTGKWIKMGGTVSYLPEDLAKLKRADLAGTWVRETTASESTNDDEGAAGTTGGGWSSDTGGMRYAFSAGKYAANTWVKVNGKWYHFNSRGYMQSGWIYDGGKWYYLNSDGSMMTGLVTGIDGHIYYFNADGSMAIGDIKIFGKTFHFNMQAPSAQTYYWDSKSETWKKNENTELPYGAETE